MQKFRPLQAITILAALSVVCFQFYLFAGRLNTANSAADNIVFILRLLCILAVALTAACLVAYSLAVALKSEKHKRRTLNAASLVVIYDILLFFVCMLCDLSWRNTM